MRKRTLAFFLGLLLTAALAAPMTAVAEDGTTPTILLNLMTRFPDLAYWNHVGSAKNNPDGVTHTPCPTHVGCSWEAGACSCNSFSNAIQCMGYAYKIGFEIVGSDPRSWEMSETLDASKLRVGDVIRYRNNRHSLCVTGVKGNVISFTDCNWYPMCQIRWSSMDLEEMPGFSYVLHATGNNLKNKNISFFESSAGAGSPTLLGSPGIAPATNEELWVTRGNMNLRKSASVNAAALDLVPEGSRVIVENKTLYGDYLWGKITYNGTDGWIALDHCEYLSGTVNAPMLRAVPEEVATGASFTLEWTAVKGADTYKVSVLDANGKAVTSKAVTSEKAKLSVDAVGNYNLQVESRSKHAESWTLQSGKTPISVKKAKDIKIESISLNKTSLALTKGQTAALAASILPEWAAVDTVQFRSGNPQVVTVDAKGAVKAVGFGETMIVCSDARSGLAAVCDVSVTPGAPKKLIQYHSKLRTTAITLKWTAVAGADSYRVYRKSGSTFKLIATSKENLFTDTGLKEATTYVYQVKACASVPGGVVSGAASPTLTASTRPAAAETVKFATKDGKVKVIWTANKQADKYVVYQSATGKTGSFKKVATVTKNNYLARSLTPGSTVYFKIQTVKIVNGVEFPSAMTERAKVKVK